jgi:hypothetical protein
MSHCTPSTIIKKEKTYIQKENYNLIYEYESKIPNEPEEHYDKIYKVAKCYFS